MRVVVLFPIFASLAFCTVVDAARDATAPVSQGSINPGPSNSGIANALKDQKEEAEQAEHGDCIDGVKIIEDQCDNEKIEEKKSKLASITGGNSSCPMLKQGQSSLSALATSVEKEIKGCGVALKIHEDHCVNKKKKPSEKAQKNAEAFIAAQQAVRDQILSGKNSLRMMEPQVCNSSDDSNQTADSESSDESDSAEGQKAQAEEEPKTMKDFDDTNQAAEDHQRHVEERKQAEERRADQLRKQEATAQAFETYKSCRMQGGSESVCNDFAYSGGEPPDWYKGFPDKLTNDNPIQEVADLDDSYKKPQSSPLKDTDTSSSSNKNPTPAPTKAVDTKTPSTAPTNHADSVPSNSAGTNNNGSKTASAVDPSAGGAAETSNNSPTQASQSPTRPQVQKARQEIRSRAQDIQAANPDMSRREAWKAARAENNPSNQILNTARENRNGGKHSTVGSRAYDGGQPAIRESTQIGTNPIGDGNSGGSPTQTATGSSSDGPDGKWSVGNGESGNVSGAGGAAPEEKNAISNLDSTNKSRDSYNPFKRQDTAESSNLYESFKKSQKLSQETRNLASGNEKGFSGQGGQNQSEVAMASRHPDSNLQVDEAPARTTAQANQQFQPETANQAENSRRPVNVEDNQSVSLSYEKYTKSDTDFIPAPPPTPVAAATIAAYHPKQVQPTYGQVANGYSGSARIQHSKPVGYNLKRSDNGTAGPSYESSSNSQGYEDDSTYNSAMKAVGNADYDDGVGTAMKKKSFIGSMKDKIASFFSDKKETQAQKDLKKGLSQVSDKEEVTSDKATVAKAEPKKATFAGEEQEQNLEEDEYFLEEEEETGFLATIADLARKLFDSSRWFGKEEENVADLVYEEDDIYADIDPVFDTVQATDGIIDVDAQDLSVKEKTIQQLMREAGHIKSEGLVDELPKLKQDTDAYGLTY